MQEINIAFPRTTPLKTTLGKRTPWRLTQVRVAIDGCEHEDQFSGRGGTDSTLARAV